MPGGKGPASPSGGEGLVSGNLGLIALFGGIVLVFGGIVAANQAGVFGDGGGQAEGVLSCDDTFTGARLHEHAQLNLYLDSDQTFDFSKARYQVADGRIHFEHGSGDGPPNGATVHIHEGRPTLGCLFQTLGWQVSEDKLVLDTGETYAEDENHEFRITVDGEASERGFNEPLLAQSSYTIRYVTTDGGTADAGNNTTTE